MLKIYKILVKGLQRHVEIDEPDEDDVDPEENEQHKFIAGALDASGSTRRPMEQKLLMTWVCKFMRARQ